jgi:hypothetical protein
MIIFLAFFFAILTNMSLIFQVLGLELPFGDTDDDFEYAKLNVFIAFFLQAFRNSIGDLATPTYDYWLEM